MTQSIVGLIPARAGSKRVIGKNVRPLAGHPLIAYSIKAALESQIFAEVIVSTESEEITAIARYYGAQVPFLRSPEYATDTSPDIEWVKETLTRLRESGKVFDCFSILRPTSPLRQPQTIQRAWAAFTKTDDFDSLRAVEKCLQHPGKMWVKQGQQIIPLLRGNEGIFPKTEHKTWKIAEDDFDKVSPEPTANIPWHSTPYQALPEVYVQNASLEIAKCRVVFEQNSIAGQKIMPFFTRQYEGLDINDQKDWWYIEHLLENQEVELPKIFKTPMTL